MSVPRYRRNKSKMEYVNTCNILYTKTINFLSRLSSRYSRLMAADTAHLAFEVTVYCEKASSVYNYRNDERSMKMRAEHFKNALSSLEALDVMIGHCYEVMMLNPSGCFNQDYSTNQAIAKIDKATCEIGELIDTERRLLKGCLASCKLADTD